MKEQTVDVIVGLHSIQAALNNKNRNIIRLVATQESIKLLNCNLSENKLEITDKHQVQEEAKREAYKIGYDLKRVPSHMFMVAEALKVHDAQYIKPEMKRILCLDSVSDVHNAAAIMRTADFYGIEALVIPQKKSFGLSPAFFRMASGAAETLPVIRVAQLSKFLRGLKDKNWSVVGLSEHADQAFEKGDREKIVLVAGAEDVGLSYVVIRECDQMMSLNTQGKIQSLNVSVATAVALEKCFG